MFSLRKSGSYLSRLKKPVASISAVALAMTMFPGAALGASAAITPSDNQPAQASQDRLRENTGAVPSYTPAKSVHDANEDKLSTQSADNLPDSYSSVDGGYITSVKDQRFTQNCWAFAAIAAIEASMLKEGLIDGTDKDSLDLAERQLAYFFYNTPVDPLGNTAGDSTDLIVGYEPQLAEEGVALESLDYLSGLGNLSLTMASVANWVGASEENKASFSELVDAYNAEKENLRNAISAKYEELSSSLEDGEEFWEKYGDEYNQYIEEQRRAGAMNLLERVKLDDSLAFDDFVHLENAYSIPMTDRDDVKQAIANYGAVVTQINSNWTAEAQPGHYYTSTGESINHEVALVGWDDNYPKENFEVKETDWRDDVPTTSIDLAYGSTVNVSLSEENYCQWLKITPEVTGYYDIDSSWQEGNNYGIELYKADVDAGKLDYVSYSSGSLYTQRLEAGSTYYVSCSTYNDDGIDSFDTTLKASEGGEDSRDSYVDTLGLDQQIQGGSSVRFSFTPAVSGNYRFETIDVAESDNAYGSLNAFNSLNNNMVSLEWGSHPYILDDEGENIWDEDSGMWLTDENNTCINAHLYAGETYYIWFQTDDDETGDLGTKFTATASLVEADEVEEETETEMPSENGAWLIKNSWGTDTGVDIDGDGVSDGYYWISYETSCLNADWASAIAYDMAPASNWDNNYQYDGSTCNCFNLVESGGSISNVYEVKGNAGGAEALGAVMLCLADTNVDYSVQVYSNPEAGDPTSGVPMLAEPVTGKTSYVGYCSVDLGQEIPLREGDTFAVVATLSKADESDVCYVVDTTCGVNDRYADGWNWIHFTSAVSAGQSFEQDRANAKWNDLSSTKADNTDEPQCCARLKAFTKNIAVEDLPAIDITKAKVTIASATYTGKVLKPAVTVKYGSKKLAQGTDYTLEYANNTNAGKASVTITGAGDYTGVLTTSFTIAKAKQTLKVSTAAKSVKYSKVKKKAQTTSKVVVKGAKTKVTYKKAGGSGKLTINKKTGKITVKKGTKKATYKIKVKASAASSTNYKAASKTVTVKVKVK